MKISFLPYLIIVGEAMKFIPDFSISTSKMSLLLAAALFHATVGLAAEGEYSLKIQNHRFEPQELVVPAGKKIRLLIENRDATPEEFESHDLNREKVIAGNASASIFIGPLAPGSYRFFGEFNEKTAKGVIVAQ